MRQKLRQCIDDDIVKKGKPKSKVEVLWHLIRIASQIKLTIQIFAETAL